MIKPKNLSNPTKELQILESTLETLLVYAGNDWVGRGELTMTRLMAQIAAVETLIIELKNP